MANLYVFKHSVMWQLDSLLVWLAVAVRYKLLDFSPFSYHIRYLCALLSLFVTLFILLAEHFVWQTACAQTHTWKKKNKIQGPFFKANQPSG